MKRTKQEELVFKTIHFQHYQHFPKDSCFMVNEAGENLIKTDASYLPAIRAALLDAAQREHTIELNGIDYVIGAFLVLSAKYDPENIVSFIEKLCRELAIEVVSAIPIFFQKNKSDGSYNYGIAPPPQLIDYVKLVAEEGDWDVQKKAKRALGWIVRDNERP